MQAAVQTLEAEAIPPERIGLLNDPRRAREVVGTPAVQLVITFAILGPIVGVVLLLAAPGAGHTRRARAGLVPWAIGGLLVGALVGKVLPARDPEAYQDRVSRGEVLITVKVAPAERRRVRSILARSGARNLSEEDTSERPDHAPHARSPYDRGINVASPRTEKIRGGWKNDGPRPSR